MENEPPCKFLDWDSAFFQQRIGSVIDRRITPETIDRIMEWRRLEQIDCLYYLAEINDADSIRLVENNGFHLVDVRITFEKQAPQPVETGLSLPKNVRLAAAEDLSILKAIARDSYSDSRFHIDHHFSPALADHLYEVWIENSVQGYANAVLVADIDQAAAGYISCHLLQDGSGNIGLVGVAPEHQGKSVGRLLVEGALAWFEANKVSRVSVVTQGRNIRGQRLYQKCGFITRSVQLWYHRWFSDLRPKTE
jgi:dTDP-4-amino-4,6-dideoxy-D-galactose acyltransferase